MKLGNDNVVNLKSIVPDKFIHSLGGAPSSQIYAFLQRQTYGLTFHTFGFALTFILKEKKIRNGPPIISLHLLIGKTSRHQPEKDE